MNKGTTVIRVFKEAPSFYLVIMLLHEGFLLSLPPLIRDGLICVSGIRLVAAVHVV